MTSDDIPLVMWPCIFFSVKSCYSTADIIYAFHRRSNFCEFLLTLPHFFFFFLVLLRSVKISHFLNLVSTQISAVTQLSLTAPGRLFFLFPRLLIVSRPASHVACVKQLLKLLQGFTKMMHR